MPPRRSLVLESSKTALQTSADSSARSTACKPVAAPDGREPAPFGPQRVLADVGDPADQADGIGAGPHGDFEISVGSDPAELLAHEH